MATQTGTVVRASTCRVEDGQKERAEGEAGGRARAGGREPEGANGDRSRGREREGPSGEYERRVRAEGASGRASGRRRAGERERGCGHEDCKTIARNAREDREVVATAHVPTVTVGFESAT